MKQVLFIIFTLCCSLGALAYENVELELSNGNSMNLTRFDGEGKVLLLWLPSERGFGQGYIPVALNLALMDYDVWAVQLHETYIIPPGRHSLNDVDQDDLQAVISSAEQRGFEEIYLVTSSRGMQLALESAYRWQLENSNSLLLRGIITFTPHLVKGRPALGQSAEYEDIVNYSNLPVYMLQPQHSTKFAHSKEIAQQLQQGGSPTFIHYLSGTQGGFQMRPDEDLTPIDIKSREQLHYTFDQAIKLLRNTQKGAFTAGYDKPEKVDQSASAVKLPALYPYTGNKKPAALTLPDLSGKIFDLSKTEGEVILVNFWATWCGPCIEEIPSLSRLVEHMKDKPFKVVAVNIGESKSDINEFLKRIPVNFDILLDERGETVRDWKVYAYPSNYLIDKNGQIQYAYRGALKWDDSSIIKKINLLF